MSIVANDTVAGLRTTIAELRQQLDERSAELNEAVKQQSATAYVLQVINQSRGDLARRLRFRHQARRSRGSRNHDPQDPR